MSKCIYWWTEAFRPRPPREIMCCYLLLLSTVVTGNSEKARCALVQGFGGLGPQLIVSVWTGDKAAPHNISNRPLSLQQPGAEWKPEVCTQDFFLSLFILSWLQTAVHVLVGCPSQVTS